MQSDGACGLRKQMTQAWLDDANALSTSTSHTSSSRACSQPQTYSCTKQSRGNVFQLLAWREISPQVKRSAKKLWANAAVQDSNYCRARCEVIDAKQRLLSWVESESLRHLSAKYCPLVPPPRSTIAAAFSPDGRTLASTHGDHTVKIIDCQTGSCLKVLSGHRRTPWVVRFHPGHPEVLASGSLDHEVRLWDANSAECIGSRDFYRPIASIAFHAQGDLLAVASGHKLYIWQYSRKGESSPSIVLRTRRSLRAVHFHPHAAPFLLTAEVNDLDSPDSPITLATSPCYLHYPPPAVVFANVHSASSQISDTGVTNQAPMMPFPCLLWPAAFVGEHVWSSQQDSMVIDSNTGPQTRESSLQLLAVTNTNNHENVAAMSSLVSSSRNLPESISNHIAGNTRSESTADMMETADGQSFDMLESRGMDNTMERPNDANNMSTLTEPPVPSVLNGTDHPQSPGRQSSPATAGASTINPSSISGNSNLQMLLRNIAVGHLHQFLPLGDPSCWELSFLQGWLMGQSHAGMHPVLPVSDGSHGGSLGIRGIASNVMAFDSQAAQSVEASGASSAVMRGGSRSNFRHRSRSRVMTNTSSGEGPAVATIEDNVPHTGGATLASDGAAPSSMSAAAAAAELPCTVKLRIWPHDIQNPCAPLDPHTCRLTIPHAVLCSEMGAHFSPCGRFLAACVACVLPHVETDPGTQMQMHQDVVGAATSPTRHPIAAHRIVYELRIYSLEEATFGEVLASRAIRAAHCLTSIQFSPTSEHILLAYGRRHNSLLRSLVVDGETTIPIYTILEVYKVSDMELVRVLPSADDEVNVACFHPVVGGGLVYGTKEGKLRLLHYDGPNNANCMGPGSSLDDNMLEVQTYALEC
ncbi:uncharacterized protein LOC116252626 isoform X1 [Nymphaea colorata]|nr:uncharacterized protein LOC116252626 isoform X1 [Nymphaea colorata]